jgi:SAM-dependent methyltransferase
VTPAPAVTWHDVEHGAYDADLPVWRELADLAGGPILDLGAGTGRVAIDLAARGHDVTALDNDPALLAALTDRAPHVTTVTADARDFDLKATFALVIAPMQLVQIIGGEDGRATVLRRAREHLEPGGIFAAAIADARDALPPESREALPRDPGEALPRDPGEALPRDPGEALPRDPGGALPGDGASPPLPDMLESDGWLFSSQPVSVQEENGCIVVTRRREAVSPTGARSEEVVEIALDLVGAEQFERELREAGFTEIERRAVAETPDHIGSTVIVCRR